MVNNHYRWDFIGLSTDEKPTPETSEKVVNGSTFYTSDDSKLYVWCDGEWYEKIVSGGGGGSDINVVQTTGQSTNDVMSQKAVTDAIAAIPTGGDAFTELTSADYNYPADNPDGIAVWLLPLGLYKFADGVKVYFTKDSYFIATTYNPLCVGVMMNNLGSISGRKFIIQFANHSSSHNRDTMRIYTVNNAGVSADYQTSGYVLRGSDIYNDLNQGGTGYVLDAYQGKVLNDKITALEARVAALEGN